MFCTNLKINSDYFPICINQLGFVMEVQCTVNDLGTAFLQATYKKFMLHTGIRNIYLDRIWTTMSITTHLYCNSQNYQIHTWWTTKKLIVTIWCWRSGWCKQALLHHDPSWINYTSDSLFLYHVITNCLLIQWLTFPKKAIAIGFPASAAWRK